MDLGLKDLHALVTGASRGLGFATAMQLAREGCRLAINSRNPANLTAAARRISAETGAEVMLLPGDLSDPQVPSRLVEAAAEGMGGLDLLFSNSGGPPAGAFASLDDAAWHAAIDLLLMSQVRLVRAALPHLQRSSSASVLTVTSYAVKQPIPGLVLSTSLRAAIVGLTKSLALEVGAAGIRVNSILPGWTETERVTELMTYRAAQNGTTMQAEIACQAQDSPLGRFATPQEFANVATFLLSPAAAYLTGLMLTVDGGMYKGTL